MHDQENLSHTPSSRLPEPPERAHALLVMILGIGFALRLYALDTNQLWLDETHSIFIAGTSLGEMVENLKNDSHPPLYFSLMLAWKSVFGESELSVRLLSVLLGMVSLLAVYWFGKTVMSRRIALTGMFLAAIAPLHVYYSQEAKSYVLLAFLSILSSGFLWSAVKGDERRYWLAYVISTGFMIHTHIFAWFALPAANAFLLLCKRHRHLFIKLLVYQSVVVLLFLPWAPFVLRQAGQSGQWVRSYWLATPPSLAIPKTLACFGAGGSYPDYLRFSHVSPLRLVSYVVFALLGGLAVLPYRDRLIAADSGGLQTAKLYLLLNLLVPLLIPYVISFVKPIYLVGRYDFMVYPFYAVLLAIGVMKLRRCAWVGLAVIGLLASYSLHRYYSMPTPAFDKEAVQYLAQTAEEDDVVVVTGLRLCPVEYYMRREGVRLRLLTYPTSMQEHPGWIDFRLSRGELLQEAIAVTESAVAQSRPGRPIWLLVFPLQSMNEPLFDEFDRRLKFQDSNENVGVLRFTPK